MGYPWLSSIFWGVKNKRGVSKGQHFQFSRFGGKGEVEGKGRASRPAFAVTGYCIYGRVARQQPVAPDQK